MTTRNSHSSHLMAASVFAAAGLALAGCSTEGPEEGVDGGAVTEGEVPEVAPGLGYDGVYDQTFYDEADEYVGQEVRVTTEVAENLSEETFVIAGADGTALDPLLVVDEMDVLSAVEGELVQLTGTVQENFDVVTTEETFGIELEELLYADHIGEPYLSITDAEVLEEN